MEKFDDKIKLEEWKRTKLVDKIILLKRQEKVANRGLRRQVGVNKKINKILKEIDSCSYILARLHRNDDDNEIDYQ